MLRASQPIGIDQCNCFTVRKAARQISRFYDAYLQPTGLRITQFLILADLNEQRSAAVHGLAGRLDIERTAMGKMIGLLERDGFVRIQPSPTDGRSRIVELTPEGKDLFKRAIPLWREAQRRFNEINGTANVGALRRSLSEMKVDDAVTCSSE
jgi:DNA-binding MarR family transcriptional regulator